MAAVEKARATILMNMDNVEAWLDANEEDDIDIPERNPAVGHKIGTPHPLNEEYKKAKKPTRWCVMNSNDRHTWGSINDLRRYKKKGIKKPVSKKKSTPTKEPRTEDP